MPATEVLVPHDDGRWYRAQLLGQHRSSVDGHWRCGVRYYVGPGEQYQRVLPAADCRAVDDPPPGWVDPRETAPAPASRVTTAGTATRSDHRIL